MYNTDVEAVDALVEKYQVLKKEISKVIVGQDDVVEQVLISIFSGGHCLLVGVPGLAKTLLVNTISDVLGLKFNRIQFTPDLMPSDIIGAMQEKAVTTAGQRFALDKPFFVLATQNPIEQEGTYPLPEAQLDRFMFNVWVDYPSYEEELAIVKTTTSDSKVALDHILNAEDIIYFQQLIRRIPVPENVLEYAVKLSTKTRPNSPNSPEIINKYVSWGAGPRASQYLVIGAKCHAALNGKYSPDIEDVQAVAEPILRHRLVRNYMAEAEGYTIGRIVKELM